MSSEIIHPVALAKGHELVQSIHDITSIVSSGFEWGKLQGLCQVLPSLIGINLAHLWNEN
jgi:hypothetical protein